MTHDEVIANIQQHQRAMDACAEISNIAASKYSAHMTLYNAAAMSGDKKGIEESHEMLHNLLDQILDSGYSIGVHSREIAQLLQKVR